MPHSADVMFTMITTSQLVNSVHHIWKVMFTNRDNEFPLVKQLSKFYGIQ